MSNPTPIPSSLVLRSTKGSVLSYSDGDGNFSILNQKINDTDGLNVGSGVGIYSGKTLSQDSGQFYLKSLSALTSNIVLIDYGHTIGFSASTQSALNTGVQGDIIYFSAANTIANLAKDVTATRYLSNTGASNNPAWAQIDLSNGVTGLLLGANGGTGVANTSKTITIGASITTTGTNTPTLAFPTGGAFTYTFPLAASTLLANNLGLSGNTILVGGTASGGTLTLSSTSDATKGLINYGLSSYNESTNFFSYVKAIASGYTGATIVTAFGEMKRSSAAAVGLEFVAIERAANTFDGAGIMANANTPYLHIGGNVGGTYYSIIQMNKSASAPTIALGYMGASVWAGGTNFDTSFQVSAMGGLQMGAAGVALRAPTTAGSIYTTGGFGSGTGFNSGNNGDVYVHSRHNTATGVHLVTYSGSAATVALSCHASGRVGIGLTNNNITSMLTLKAGTASGNTAPLQFNSGPLESTARVGCVEFLTDSWYGTTTTNAVRRMIVMGKTGRSTGQTAAVASVAAYTLGASDASYEVSANVLVTTATSHSFTVTVTYTDEGSTSRTLTLSFTLMAGGTLVTLVTNGNGAVPYMGIPQHIRCKGGTAITIATVGTFTTVTYNVEGIIKQTA